jgi:hypothetical protein
LRTRKLILVLDGYRQCGKQQGIASFQHRVLAHHRIAVADSQRGGFPDEALMVVVAWVDGGPFYLAAPVYGTVELYQCVILL